MPIRGGAGPLRSPTTGEGLLPDLAHRRIPRPSSTSVSFALLVALVVLTGVFIGEWLWLGTLGGRISVQLPLLPLLVPPLVILLATAALTALEPGIVVRRRRLVPVPDDAPGAVRFRQLTVEAGLRRPPTLMYNPTDAGSSARSVGRPGRYLVIVSPTILAAARRRRAVFDIIVRHELAHIAAADVGRATFAVRAWHVTLVAMAVPVVSRLWIRDLSLVPSFLLRAGVLALVVYTVRAQLLRLREHHADLGATPTADDQRQFSSTLGLPAPGGTTSTSPAPLDRWRRPRWLSLHPCAARRIVVVNDPGLLGSANLPSVLAAGYVAGAAYGPVHNLLFATGLNPLVVGYASRGLLLGAASLVVVAEIARAASVRRCSGLAFAAPAAALVLGALLGTALSVEGAGLETFAGAELVEMFVPAAAVGATILVVADIAGRTRALSATGWAGLLVPAVGLGAVALLWEPVGLAAANVGVDLPAILMNSPVMPWLGLLLGVVGILVMPRPARLTALGGGAIFAFLIVASTLGALLSGSALDHEAAAALASGLLPLVLTTAVVVAGVATARHGAATGIASSCLGAALAGAAFLAIVAARGVPLAWDDVAATLSTWTALAVVLALPAAGLASVAGVGTRPVGAPLIIGTLATAVTVYVGIGVVLLATVLAPVPVPSTTGLSTPGPTPTVPTPANPTPAAELREAYLTGDLDVLVMKWRIAQMNTHGTEALKERRQFIEQGLMPLYDEALSAAAEVTPWVQGTGDALIVETHTALVDAITTDRTYWLVWASRDMTATRAAAGDAAAANDRFEAAQERLIAAG